MLLAVDADFRISHGNCYSTETDTYRNDDARDGSPEDYGDQRRLVATTGRRQRH